MIMLNDSLFISLSQFSYYLKKLFKSVSVRKSNLKLCAVTSKKDSYQTQKIQISVTESSTSTCTTTKTLAPRFLE